MDPFQTLQRRGYIQQCTHPDEVGAALRDKQVTFYIGFDATATSLHVGSLLQIMLMAHLQRAGHRPIVVLGGGTTMIGDPSGKTELRQMLTPERIQQNADGIRRQLEHFLVLDGEQGVLVNNAEWLLELKYIEFLRDIGRQFSVNRMLAAEAYKQRLERGLSFIEFNYQILQAYDFLELYRRHGCTMQFGGDDQWGNILAGTDLVRRMEQAEVYGITTPLVTTATGAKMGKTEKGAVWLDGDQLSPFDYFQYWLNVDDRDVGRFLRLYTFLPEEEIARLEQLEGADIRRAKRELARQTTTLLHGEEAADQAEAAGRAMVAGEATDDMPSHQAEVGTPIYAVLADAGMCKSRSEGRRLVKGGGVRLDGDKIDDPERPLTQDDVGPDGAVLRVGKKRAVRITLT